MTVSVVIETWNAVAPLPALLAQLAPQVAAVDAEVVITHTAALDRAGFERALGRPFTALELPGCAGYYEHKNRGFAASCGSVVAFIDGDCMPGARWVDALTKPIRAGEAVVVAGATAYSGSLGALASELDFPYFDAATRRRTIDDAPATVQNFFANNVAFARDVFAARGFPVIEPMFHGQCQVLALRLSDDAIAIAFAPAARVIHAWPGSAREWLEARLLRGADLVSLMPFLLDRHAPRLRPAPLCKMLALGLLGIRALGGISTAVRHRSRLRGLGLVTAATVIEGIGAVAAPVIYRRHRRRAEHRRFASAAAPR